MNKTLIFAFTIAFSSFAAADELAELGITQTSSSSLVASTAGIIPSFQTIDTDQDNTISLTEAENAEGLVNVFLDIDLDRTGDLSEVEYNKFTMVSK